MKTNETLQRDVMEALRYEPILNATDIGVAARDGVVTLSGMVDSYPKKIAAEHAAKRVSGVRAVAEDIEVRLWGTNRKNDTELAAAAANAILWCNSIPEDKIKITVERGWVKLEGEVEWQFQKDEVTREISELTGVRGITNLILLKPIVKPSYIKDKIHRAFGRSATVDAGSIGIDVNGSIVRLHGKVRSWAEREDAENAAWSAPGVTIVEDELRVAEFESI